MYEPQKYSNRSRSQSTRSITSLGGKLNGLQIWCKKFRNCLESFLYVWLTNESSTGTFYPLSRVKDRDILSYWTLISIEATDFGCQNNKYIQWLQNRKNCAPQSDDRYKHQPGRKQNETDINILAANTRDISCRLRSSYRRATAGLYIAHPIHKIANSNHVDH